MPIRIHKQFLVQGLDNVGQAHLENGLPFRRSVVVVLREGDDWNKLAHGLSDADAFIARRDPKVLFLLHAPHFACDGIREYLVYLEISRNAPFERTGKLTWSFDFAFWSASHPEFGESHGVHVEVTHEGIWQSYRRGKVFKELAVLLTHLCYLFDFIHRLTRTPHHKEKKSTRGIRIGVRHVSAMVNSQQTTRSRIYREQDQRDNGDVFGLFSPFFIRVFPGFDLTGGWPARPVTAGQCNRHRSFESRDTRA
ncbi:MAG: hypothetical protein AAFW87_10850 [Pseudomonadota bacterium]